MIESVTEGAETTASPPTATSTRGKKRSKPREPVPIAPREPPGGYGDVPEEFSEEQERQELARELGAGRGRDGEPLEEDDGLDVPDMVRPPRGRAAKPGPVPPLPTPSRFDFSDDYPGFFKYWASLSAEEVRRSLVYVYRNWPVWNPAQILTDDERDLVARGKLRLTTNIAKLSEPWTPREWENELYHRFGAGDYHLKLNDVNAKRTVAMVSIRGLRDFDNYPPVVDPRAVVLTDPANASYLERMRIKGKTFPGDVGYQENDMAANEAVKDLTNTVDRLVTRVVDGNRNSQPDARAQGDLRAVESVAEGAKQGMKIMGDAIQAAEQARAKAADPKEYLRDTIEMAKLLTPPAQSNNGMEMMMQFMTTTQNQMQAMFQMQMEHSRLMIGELKDRLAYSERTLQTILEAKTAPAAAPATNGAPVVSARPPSMLDELEKLISLKDRLESLTGGGGGDGTPSWVPYAFQGLNVLVSGATNFAHNLAVAKTGMGAALAPPAPAQMPGGDDTGPDNEPMLQPPTQGNPEQERMNFINFAKRLHTPLINALQQGISGTEFAAHMILHEGAMAYNYLAGLGKEGILNVLQMYPPIWQDVIKVPQQFDTFLDQFVMTDDAHALAVELKNAAAEAQADPEPAPAPQAAPPRATAPSRAPAPPSPSPMAKQPGEQRRTVSGPGGKPVEVIAPRPPAAAAPEHRAPKVNPEPPAS